MKENWEEFKKLKIEKEFSDDIGLYNSSKISIYYDHKKSYLENYENYYQRCLEKVKGYEEIEEVLDLLYEKHQYKDEVDNKITLSLNRASIEKMYSDIKEKLIKIDNLKYTFKRIDKHYNEKTDYGYNTNWKEEYRRIKTLEYELTEMFFAKQGVLRVVNNLETEYAYGLVDRNGNVILNSEYEDIALQYEYEPNYVAVKKNNWYFVNLKGEKISDEYRDIWFEKEFRDLAIVKIDYDDFRVLDIKNRCFVEKKIVFDGSVKTPYIASGEAWQNYLNNWQKENTYKKVEEIPSKWNVQQNNKLYYLYNKKGEQILKSGYDNISIEPNDWIIIKKGKGYGLLDNNGTIIEPCTSINQCISSVYDGNICIERNGKWGIIDTDKTEIIPFEYEYLSFYEDGLIAATKDGKSGIINLRNKIIIPFGEYNIKYNEYFSRHGLIKLTARKKGNNWDYPEGLFSKKLGKIILSPIYDIITIAGNCLKVKYRKNQNQEAKYGIFDFEGNKIHDFKFEYVFELDSDDDTKINLYKIEDKGKWAIFDADFNQLTDFIYTTIGYNYLSEGKNKIKSGKISEGLIGVERNGKWGYVDLKGQEVIQCNYIGVERFRAGLAAVRISHTNFTLIDKSGSFLLPPIFKKLSDDKLVFKTNKYHKLVAVIFSKNLLRNAYKKLNENDKKV